MDLHLDLQSAAPIFEQIVFQVKGAVARGELREGDRLPSVRDLAKRLRVNPNTVVKAYDALHRDEVIVRRQGAGCFIAENGTTRTEDARRRQLDELVERAVTEAFHLGFQASDVQEAVRTALRSVRFEKSSSAAKRRRNPGATS